MRAKQNLQLSFEFYDSMQGRRQMNAVVTLTLPTSKQMILSSIQTFMTLFVGKKIKQFSIEESFFVEKMQILNGGKEIAQLDTDLYIFTADT